MKAKFWLNTALHLVVPGGWGRYRLLKQYRDPAYDHAKHKHVVREKHNGAGGWAAEAKNGVLSRDYSSYEEYSDHQRQKFTEILKIAGGFDNRTIFDYRLRFYRRFKHLVGRIGEDATIVCAGARQGTEVEVLRDLGFHNAYGIDLNPGPENPLVRSGDFMKMAEESGSVDLVYTNCVDHAFDLDSFFGEHSRVLKADGFALYDLAVMTERGRGAFEAISWDRTEDLLVSILNHFDRVIMLEREASWMWVLVQGKTTRG